MSPQISGGILFDSIMIEHHFGMGDSASCQSEAMSNLAVRVSPTLSCQKKLFVARALGTANACNPFLGLILRTVNSISPTSLPLALVYIKCSLHYHPLHDSWKELHLRRDFHGAQQLWIGRWTRSAAS